MLTISKLSIALGLCLLPGCFTPARQRPAAVAFDASVLVEDEASEGHGVGHVLLLYIPNRICDLLDIVRARLRVGPGLAFGARATELADFYIGAYGSVWAGLPGPREAPTINWPFGLESKSGVEVSVADASVEGGVNYGFLEVGLGGQLLIIGADVGVDVWELADFVTGLICIDLVDDSL